MNSSFTSKFPLKLLLMVTALTLRFIVPNLPVLGVISNKQVNIIRALDLSITCLCYKNFDERGRSCCALSCIFFTTFIKTVVCTFLGTPCASASNLCSYLSPSAYSQKSCLHTYTYMSKEITLLSFWEDWQRVQTSAKICYCVSTTK